MLSRAQKTGSHNPKGNDLQSLTHLGWASHYPNNTGTEYLNAVNSVSIKPQVLISGNEKQELMAVAIWSASYKSKFNPRHTYIHCMGIGRSIPTRTGI